MRISTTSFKDTHHSLQHLIAFLRVFVLYLLLFQVLFITQVDREYLKAVLLFKLLFGHSLLFFMLIFLHTLGSLHKLHSFLPRHIYSLVIRLHLPLLLIDHHLRDRIWLIMIFEILRTFFDFL